MRVYDILNEDYSARINSVVELLRKKAPIPKDMVDYNIDTAARALDVVELKMGGARWNEFKKDVVLALRHNRLIKKAPSTRAPYYVDDGYGRKVPVTHQDIEKLGWKMQEFAGEVFPDGDPNDLLVDYFRSKGWDSYDAFQRLVPVAAKKHLGTKDYYEYLANMWDDYHADNTDARDILDRISTTNPWRSH